MNHAIFFLTFILLIFAGDASAVLNCSNAVTAIRVLSETCDHVKELGTSLCVDGPPAKRTEQINFGQMKYGVFTAGGKFATLQKKVSEEIYRLRSEPPPCPGGCTKTAIPELRLETEPSETVLDKQCPLEKVTPIEITAGIIPSDEQGVEPLGTNGVKKVIALKGEQDECREKMQSWSEAVLTGGNAIGEHLDKVECPSPCSFTSVVSVRTRDLTGVKGCEGELTMKVLCGPPKKRAEWITNATMNVEVLCGAML